MEYRYVPIKDDTPWSLAVRFGVNFRELQRRNAEAMKNWDLFVATAAKTGSTIEIPFRTDPSEGYDVYPYDYARKGGRLKDICDLSGAAEGLREEKDEQGKPRYELWNIYHMQPQQLWDRWENQEFNAWQRKRGGNPNLLFQVDAGGESSPPLYLPAKQPMVLAPRDVAAAKKRNDTQGAPSPSPSPPANGTNRIEKPALSVEVELYAKKLELARSVLKDWLDAWDDACNKVDEVLAYARALSGLVDRLHDSKLAHTEFGPWGNAGEGLLSRLHSVKS
jgi:hypothetical protein